MLESGGCGALWHAASTPFKSALEANALPYVHYQQHIPGGNLVVLLGTI